MAKTSRKRKSLTQAALHGSAFKTEEGLRFRVISTFFTHESEISKRRMRVIGKLDPWQLIALPWRGENVPIVRVEDGIVRIMVISINGEHISMPNLISRKLGLTKGNRVLIFEA